MWLRKEGQPEIVRKSSGHHESRLGSSEGSVQLQKQKKLTYNCFNFSCEKVGKSVIVKEPGVNREVKNQFFPLTHRCKVAVNSQTSLGLKKLADVHSKLRPYTLALEYQSQKTRSK